VTNSAFAPYAAARAFTGPGTDRSRAFSPFHESADQHPAINGLRHSDPSAWLVPVMNGQVSPFDYPGTYAFTSADVKYFVNNVQQSDTSVPGSISVTVFTPEPEAAGLMGIGLLLIGSFLVRATRRALH
jgi:hypothetical protein